MDWEKWEVYGSRPAPLNPPIRGQKRPYGVDWLTYPVSPLAKGQGIYVRIGASEQRGMFPTMLR